MSLARAFTFGLVAGSLIFTSTLGSPSAYAKQAKAKKSTGSAEEMVLSQLKSLKSAALKGDAQAMADLWTEDCRYVDDTGSTTNGREALAKRFKSGIDNDKPSEIKFKPENFRLLSKTVAVSEGTVLRKDADSDELVPSTRYMMVFVNKGGKWLISSANETEIESQEADDYLSELSWLIGKWSTESESGKLTMTAKWIAERNFIYCRFEIEKPGEPKMVEAQVIGWDPLREAPRSWLFTSNGGYSEGLWENRNGNWIIDSTAVQRDGGTSSSMNVISPQGKDSFTWKATNRMSDGVPSPDTVLLKVKRVASSK